MQLLPLGKRELFNKLISLKPSGLLWLAVVFSIISTEIIVIPLSIFFNGRLTYDFFVTGLVCASLVSLVVSYLLIHLINKVRDSEKEFRTIFESATDALFIIDMEGNIIDINRTAYSRLGYTKEEMLSMSISELDMQEAANTAPTRLEDVRRYGSGVFESAHRKKDGTSMPVEVNGMTIDFGGKSVIFSIVRDITERKKAEKDKDTLLQEIHHRVKN
ncbi:MAG TPA: PAS domain S-box protein, partial [Dissulfurispiraceae bacterium]|nr:PAS domain S-box protein [Dissulfurispiraceae bacterium]